MNVFSQEEIGAFIKKVLTNPNESEFLEFRNRCAAKAEAETIFQFDMDSLPMMYFVSMLHADKWGPVAPLTPQQIAMIRMADAFCREIYEMMVEEMMQKAKTDKPN
jgi:hypothetical protein